MPEWERLHWSVGWLFGWAEDEFILRLGEDNSLNYSGKFFRWNTSAEAKSGILAQAQRLRQMADEIEAAVASAPEEA